MMNDEEQIQELYRLYWKYMIDKDVNGLHEIQSEDYFLCHMTGVKQTRAEFEKVPSTIIQQTMTALRS